MTDRLLRAHFVRRFLDNDLISPDADRHDVMAMLSAVLISGGLFVTFLMGFKYLTMVYQSPGRTAVGAVSDRLFLFGCSMEVMALAALLSWNALSLDARDIAILAPLPITRRRIVRAKLEAVFAVAAVFGLVLNTVTAVVYPVLLVGKLPVGLATTAWMVGVHGVISLAAGAFGFLVVLATRESLHAVVGPARFARVSTPVHAALTVAVMASLLLLPGMSSDAARRWFTPPPAARWVVPPLWFVGLHEQIVAETMVTLPHEPPPRFIAGYEARFAALYEGARPAFPGLGRAAMTGLALVTVVALPAYWWNNRRFDGSPPVPMRSGRARSTRRAVILVNRLLVRHPVTQAGFWLALRCVTRSLPHRISMAFALAVGVATLMVGLPVAWVSASSSPAIPLAALAPQLVALGALALGFRHAAGLPADLRANWMFHVAWLGETGRYLSGMKRFALVGLIAPAALLLVPVHATLLGLRLAAIQAALGILLAAVLLEVVFLGFERLPLATAHAPSGTLNTRGPVYLFASIGVVYGTAVLMRVALSSATASATSSGVLVSTYAAVTFLARRRARRAGAFALDDTPDLPTQRLGLS